ncbi:SWIM-type domain-containing protein [Aphis craccivora]|uniref:SWIM-type domain-containing protein n=1 Tax=Aphis craccivora TaxID=307492 RepID=A0A6G0Y550_APHCR|nr:SWIM-type domain-containing protein [Aphis craccivora]
MSLSLLRIFTYANCTLNSRSAIEGEQILKSKQIILCGKIEMVNMTSAMSIVIQIRALINCSNITFK